jgi:peptidoglycan/LPS O-acetylase OafA/YrhL
MRLDRTRRWLALYAISVGAALLGWWSAYGIGALPPDLAPLDVRPGHIAVELALGAALIAGGLLTAWRARIARPVLVAALGGLCYATLNVAGDYLVQWPMRASMSVLLAITSASAVVTLVLTVRRER